MANQEQQNIGIVGTQPQQQIKVLSPIAWGKKHNKPAQMVYSWLREGKLPTECIYQDVMTGRQMLIEDAMDAWYEQRQAAKSGQTTTKYVNKPEQILGLMVEWFDKAGQKPIAEALKKVHDEIVKEAEQDAHEAAASESAANSAENLNQAAATKTPEPELPQANPPTIPIKPAELNKPADVNKPVESNKPHHNNNHK